MFFEFEMIERNLMKLHSMWVIAFLVKEWVDFVRFKSVTSQFVFVKINVKDERISIRIRRHHNVRQFVSFFIAV